MREGYCFFHIFP